MRFRRIKEEEPGFSTIAPLIDIVFLLLIFFMATTHSSSATSLSVSLPETSAEYSGQAVASVTITVDRSGVLRLKGALIEPTGLEDELQRLKPGGGPFNVLLQADKEVSHGKVVEIMDTAKRAGAVSIFIAASPNRSKEQ